MATYELEDGFLQWPRRHQVVVKVAVVVVLVAVVVVFPNPVLIFLAALGGLTAIGTRLIAFRRGHIKTDAAGLHLDGSLVAPLRELGAGIAVATERESHVWGFGKTGRFAFRLQVESRGEGLKLLAAMGLAPAQQAPEVLLKAGPMMRWVWLVPAVLGAGVVPIAMLLSALSDDVGLVVGVALLVVVAVGPFAFQILGAKRIRLGTDGVTVRRVGLERFIPYGEIQEVKNWKPHRVRGTEYLPRGFTIVPRNGRIVRLRTAEARQVYGQGSEADADFVATSIREGMEPGSSRPPPALLDRRERPVAEWIAALRARSSIQRDYRSASSGKDELWNALEDPRMAPDSRAAAAIALAADASDEDRERLKFAGASSACRKLRNAIEAALTGRDALLADSLRTLVR